MRFSDGRLLQLSKDFEQHKVMQDARWDKALAFIEDNNRTTEALVRAVEQLDASTRGIVQLYADVKGAARVGQAIQSMLFWVAKWGTLGGVVYAAAHSLIEHFARGGPPT